MGKRFDEQELLRMIRDGVLFPERSGEYWGKEERERLSKLFTSGTGISEIALMLQRTELAVVQQLITGKLLTPPGAGRNRSCKKPHCLCESCRLNQNCEKCNKGKENIYAGDL